MSELKSAQTCHPAASLQKALPDNVPLFLGRDIIRHCLPRSEIFEVVQSALTGLGSGAVVSGPKAGFGIQLASDHLHMGTVSGCLIDLNVAGVKWFVTSELNPSRNLPRVPATIIMSDATTGLLSGVLDATELTAWRTAAMAVQATLHASAASGRKVAIIGAGAIGRAAASFFVTDGSVRQVTVCSREASSAQRLCAELRKQSVATVAINASDDIRSAVSDADIVVTATGVASDTDLVRAEWLKDEAVICAVGSYREVSLNLIHGAANIIVDDLKGAKARGNLASAFASGDLHDENILCSLGEFFAGAIERPTQKPGHTLIVLVGLGVIDLALGARALRNARCSGHGIELSNEHSFSDE